MSPAIADGAHARGAAIITRRKVRISSSLVPARRPMSCFNSRPCAGHEPHDGHCRAVRIGELGSRYSEISTVPTLLNRLAVMSFGTTWLSGGSGRLLSAQRTEMAKFQK